MGLKEAGPYFQRIMQNKVLNGLVYEIFEIYIDDEFLDNTRRVFDRLCDKNVAVFHRKTELGLAEVEYVGHLVSPTGTSFTPEKRMKVLDFPQPTTQKEMLQFIGLANYFRDHVPNMTEMVKPLRGNILLVEDWQAYLDDGGLRRFQALSTSYLELLRTLLPEGHRYTYPPNGRFRLRYRWLPLHSASGTVFQ